MGESMRKVTLNVKSEVIIEMDDGIKIEDVVTEIRNTLEYDFNMNGTTMVDAMTQDYEVIDSK